MTCGCCHPEAFREGDNRVFGYAVVDRPGSADRAIRNLHYVGAEQVFTDECKGSVRHRPSLRILRKVMRPGDRLVIEDEKALGAKPEYVAANLTVLEARGIDVRFISKDYFG